MELAAKHGIEMPIAAEVAAVVKGERGAVEAFRGLRRLAPGYRTRRRMSSKPMKKKTLALKKTPVAAKKKGPVAAARRSRAAAARPQAMDASVLAELQRWGGPAEMSSFRR